MDIVIVKGGFNYRYNDNSTFIDFCIQGNAYQNWGKWLNHLCKFSTQWWTTQIIYNPFEELLWYYHLPRKVEVYNTPKWYCLNAPKMRVYFHNDSNNLISFTSLGALLGIKISLYWYNIINTLQLCYSSFNV